MINFIYQSSLEDFFTRREYGKTSYNYLRNGSKQHYHKVCKYAKLEPYLEIQKQFDAIVPSSIREITEQQKRWSELNGASVFSKLGVLPSIGKAMPFIDWSQLNQTTSVLENILKS